jgi:hypothetical protein
VALTEPGSGEASWITADAPQIPDVFAAVPKGVSLVPEAAVPEAALAISGDSIVLRIASQGFSRFEVAISPCKNGRRRSFVALVLWQRGGIELRSGTTKERWQFYKNYLLAPAGRTPRSRRAAPYDITATDEDQVNADLLAFIRAQHSSHAGLTLGSAGLPRSLIEWRSS